MIQEDEIQKRFNGHYAGCIGSYDPDLSVWVYDAESDVCRLVLNVGDRFIEVNVDESELETTVEKIVDKFRDDDVISDTKIYDFIDLNWSGNHFHHRLPGAGMMHDPDDYAWTMLAALKYDWAFFRRNDQIRKVIAEIQSGLLDHDDSQIIHGRLSACRMGPLLTTTVDGKVHFARRGQIRLDVLKIVPPFLFGPRTTDDEVVKKQVEAVMTNRRKKTLSVGRTLD